MSGSVWSSEFYLKKYEHLLSYLEPDAARSKAKVHRLISQVQWEKLIDLAERPYRHNETLLRHLEKRPEAFSCLVEIVRAQGDSDLAAHLERALRSHTQTLPADSPPSLDARNLSLASGKLQTPAVPEFLQNKAPAAHREHSQSQSQQPIPAGASSGPDFIQSPFELVPARSDETARVMSPLDQISGVGPSSLEPPATQPDDRSDQSQPNVQQACPSCGCNLCKPPPESIHRQSTSEEHCERQAGRPPAEKAPVADPNTEVKLTIIKVMLLGITGADKSALLQELQAKPRYEHSDSTDIAGIGTFFGTDDCKSAWKEGASELKLVVADMICKPPQPPVLPTHFPPHPTNAATAKSSSSPDPSLPPPPSAMKPMSAYASFMAKASASTVSSRKSPLIEGVVNQLRAPEYFRHLRKPVSRGWRCFFRVYDTGGQGSYRCTRHVMLSGPRTSYVIVYNAGRSITAASLPAMLAYIHHALDAIRNVPGFRESRVYIVGCRIDERKEGKEGLEKDKADILDSLNSDRFREMVTEDRIFFIQNRSSSDHQKGRTPSPDLIKLRYQLTEDGKRQPHVPFARLYEMLAFHELAAAPRAKPWISLAEAKQLGEMLGNVRDEKSLRAMLTYHSGIGSVLYYPSMELKDRVMVRIEAMVEVMSAIIQPGLPVRFQHRISDDEKSLYRSCFITESMALILWRQHCPHLYKFLEGAEDRKFFLQLMEHLNVLCAIGEVSMVGGKEKRRVYLLPALANDTEEVGPNLTSITSEPFYLATKDGGHFPHSTFTQLGVKSIARHHKESPSSAAWRGCGISTTSMRIPWQHCPPVWLLLYHLQGGISLRLEASRKAFYEQCGPTGLASIKEMLEDLKGTANADLELEERMRCGCGQKTEVLCMYHRMESCGKQDASCFHCVTLPADVRNRVMCRSRVVAVDADGLRFWKELRQDQDTFQLLPLDSAEKAAERRASQLPAVNGWQSQEYRRNYENLIKRMRPQELTTKCMTLSLLSDYDLEEIDVEKKASQKNAIILKVLGSSASLFGTFREILHCIPNCRDIAKEVDSVGPTRSTDKGCLHARRVLEKNGNVSTPTD